MAASPGQVPPSSPPRKRRMASLNAEFFVHYSSSSYKHTNNKTNEQSNSSVSAKDNTILSDNSAKLNKRKRTISPVNSLKKDPKEQQTRPKKESEETEVTSTNLTSQTASPQPPPAETALKNKKTVPTRAASKAKLAKKEETSKIEPDVPSSRPRREASMRATALIIQTSEIEKSRYYTSNKEAAKNDREDSESESRKKPKTSTAKAAQDALFKKPAAQKKPTAKTKTKNKNSLSSDESVSASSSANSSIQKRNEKVVLTEEIILAHNKLNGTLGRGASTSFNSTTKMYIMKWAIENDFGDQVPFEAGQIPIETFGVKILDQPQYLKNKNAIEPVKLVAKDTEPPVVPPIDVPLFKQKELIACEIVAAANNLNDSKNRIEALKDDASSVSGSVPLIVDETSILVEPVPNSKNANDPVAEVNENKEADVLPEVEKCEEKLDTPMEVDKKVNRL